MKNYIIFAALLLCTALGIHATHLIPAKSLSEAVTAQKTQPQPQRSSCSFFRRAFSALCCCCCRTSEKDDEASAMKASLATKYEEDQK